MTQFVYSSPNIIEFYGESLADLAKMPTTTKLGEIPYEKRLAPEGARAKILTTEGLKRYMLRSTGWVEIVQTSSGSGGGLPDGYTYATDGDIDNLFPSI